MERGGQVDALSLAAASDALTSRPLLLILLASLSLCASAQDGLTASAQELFEQERWTEVVKLLESAPRPSADLDYYYGVALAHLERWDQARDVLRAGSRLQPRDKRFPVELAGIDFKQKNYGEAKAHLRRALRLDPKDEYANDFLAAVYFLQGNLEAAVKYWNSAGKPAIAALRNEPELRIRPALLDHAFAFAPMSTLKLAELRTTEARLNGLEIFPSYRIDLAARPEGNFDSVLRASELNGFGNTRLQALLHVFRGLPFQQITPEYDNFGGSAINFFALARWDPDKRRWFAQVSGPLGSNPEWRFRVVFDLRNENWEIRNGFTGPAPILAALNLRRNAGSAEIVRLVGWRWRWGLGVELSDRDNRNVLAGTLLTPQLLRQGFQLKQTAHLEFALLRSPEHRLSVSNRFDSQAGRLWSQTDDSFEKLQALLDTHWLPQAKGDDLETRWQLRAGQTSGSVPFDELFMLGLERDNNLWLRAHIGTRNGRKGSAPLGRDYVLSNYETDKNVYSNGFFTVKLGPFLDTGKMLDTSTSLGSRQWLWDTGAQAKLRVLGVGVTFSYGKDLRTGNNAYYATLAH